MLTLSLRNLLVHKLRLLLTIATVAVGGFSRSGAVLESERRRMLDSSRG